MTAGLKPSRLWLYGLLVRLMPETRFFGLKRFVLRWCGVAIGRDVRICSSAQFAGNGHIVIGDDVWIGAMDYLAATGANVITIDSHCDLGPGVMILTGSHEITPAGDHIGGNGSGADVHIGAGCWLGARSTVLAGVELAPKTLVAAGAVVIESCEERCVLLTGVPASKKRSLSQ